MMVVTMVVTMVHPLVGYLDLEIDFAIVHLLAVMSGEVSLPYE